MYGGTVGRRAGRALRSQPHDPSCPPGSLANLGIELTTRCNSDCVHCFARVGAASENALTPDLARTLCREGYNAGFRQLHFTGGEPLLWSGLFDLLEMVCELGYDSVFLNTNGLLVTEAVASRLAQFPGLGISVSLQGPAPLHDAMRGRGAYDKAAEGILRALEAGLAVTIFAALGQTLLMRLPAYAAELNATFAGIERLTLIQLFRPEKGRCDFSDELLGPEDFLRMVRTVSALNLCGFTTHVLNDPLVNVVAGMLRLPLVPRSHPLVRPGKLMVRANLDITLAHSTPEIIGQYRPGMITKTLTCDCYCNAVAQDDTTCPMCPYIDQCRKHGKLHPSPSVMDMQPEVPYCQRVLAGIEQPV